jgi:hypothetical protein
MSSTGELGAALPAHRPSDEDELPARYPSDDSDLYPVKRTKLPSGCSVSDADKWTWILTTAAGDKIRIPKWSHYDWETPPRTWLPSPPPSPRLLPYKIVEHFGEPAYDYERGFWLTSLLVEDDGAVMPDSDDDDMQIMHLGQDNSQRQAVRMSSPHGTALSANTCQNLHSAGKFGLAAGKIYIMVKEMAPAGRLNPRSIVTMTGFWVGKEKFVTAAHFLEMKPNTDADATMVNLRLPNAIRPAASVSPLGISRDSKKLGSKNQTLYPQHFPNF